MNLKSEIVTIRVSIPEKKALRRAARREASSNSEYVRALIRQDLRRSGLWPTPQIGGREEKCHN